MGPRGQFPIFDFRFSIEDRIRGGNWFPGVFSCEPTWPWVHTHPDSPGVCGRLPLPRHNRHSGEEGGGRREEFSLVRSPARLPPVPGALGPGGSGHFPRWSDSGFRSFFLPFEPGRNHRDTEETEDPRGFRFVCLRFVLKVETGSWGGAFGRISVRLVFPLCLCGSTPRAGHQAGRTPIPPFVAD